MILWVKRLGLIAGLALFIFACEESGEIGINLDPERGGFLAKYVEIPLKVSVIQVDTLLTSNRERVLISRVEDPDFGLVKTNAFSRLYLSNVLEVDSTAVCDSLLLRVRLDYFYGPDDMLFQEINVHQLADTLETKNYFSRDSVPYYPMPIGQAMIDLNRYDTIAIDTTITIQLQDSVGQWILNGIASDTLNGDNQDNFHAFFSGLAFLPGNQNTKSIGVDLFDERSRLTLYYHTEDDTLSTNFIFVSDLGEASYFYNIHDDKSGTALEGLVDYNKEYFPGNGYNYTQAGTGIVTRISMTPVINFFDSIGNSLINSAELAIRTDEYSNRFEPPSGLQLYILDEENKFIIIGNTFKSVRDERTANRESLVMNFVKDEYSNQGSYSGFMTIFTQELLSNLSEDSVFATTPASYNTTLTRFVGIDDDLIIKLYYSEVK